jgi:hypothetical protein
MVLANNPPSEPPHPHCQRRRARSSAAAVNRSGLSAGADLDAASDLELRAGVDGHALTGKLELLAASG